MNTSTTQTQQVEQQLRQNWGQIRHQILDEFPQVTPSELDAARSVDDLVARIADLSRHSERYVESKLADLASQVGGGSAQYSQTNGGQQGAQRGSQGQQEQQQNGQPFGSSNAQQSGSRFADA